MMPSSNCHRGLELMQSLGWHCIVGRNFGSFVTHGMMTLTYPSWPVANGSLFTETKHFIYFYLGHCAILLFKTQ
jgi:dynein light chain LC8-type